MCTKIIPRRGASTKWPTTDHISSNPVQKSPRQKRNLSRKSLHRPWAPTPLFVYGGIRPGGFGRPDLRSACVRVLLIFFPARVRIYECTGRDAKLLLQYTVGRARAEESFVSNAAANPSVRSVCIWTFNEKVTRQGFCGRFHGRCRMMLGRANICHVWSANDVYEMSRVYDFGRSNPNEDHRSNTY